MESVLNRLNSWIQTAVSIMKMLTVKPSAFSYRISDDKWKLHGIVQGVFHLDSNFIKSHYDPKNITKTMSALSMVKHYQSNLFNY